MDERHTNLDLYFGEQKQTLEKYIFPLIGKHKKITPGIEVLEIGCGYGGNLIPFLEFGCKVTGIDIRDESIKFAKENLNRYSEEQLTLIAEDIKTVKGMDKKFDVIFMKDTLEHIPNHDGLIKMIRKFLKDDGVIFQGFPPWRNPFGGHQQMCESKLLSRLPWFHIAPRPIFKGILKLFKENPSRIEGFLADVYDTRISIQRFKKLVKENDLDILSENLYFINPNYEVKFNLKPRLLAKGLSVPYLRDFYTTTAYYILGKKE